MTLNRTADGRKVFEEKCPTGLQCTPTRIGVSDNTSVPATDTEAVSDGGSAVQPDGSGYPGMNHDFEDLQDLLDSADQRLPQPSKSLWRNQSAWVKDKNGKEHHIHPVLVDTGANKSIVTNILASRLALRQRPTLEPLFLADDSMVYATSFVTLRLRLPDIRVEEIEINALLLPKLPNRYDLLIGLVDIEKNRLVAKIAEIQQGWENSTGFGSTPEPEAGLACTLMSSRTKAQKAEDAKRQKAVDTMAATLLLSRNKVATPAPSPPVSTSVFSHRAIQSWPNATTVPSSSGLSTRATTQCWSEASSQTTDITTPSETSQRDGRAPK
ncbi:hypothetical protein PG984_010442 [Apiospora sp. TS-2023a]